MPKLNRIDWKRGMEIMPETFIGAEEYHDQLSMINRQLMVPLAYGLVPLQKFELKCTVHDQHIILEKVNATIMNCDGHLIHLSEGVKIPLPRDAHGIYYLAVSIEGDRHIEENGVPYLKKEYHYQIINLLNTYTPSLFPILKLHASHGDWEDMDFIPPCCTVSAHPEFARVAELCVQWLKKILSITGQKDYGDLSFQLGSLLIDTADTAQCGTSSMLITRLKKALLILLTYHLLDESDQELLTKAEEFVWRDYNPNTLFETMQDAMSLIHCSIEFLERVEPKSAPVVEKTKPEPEEEELTYML